MFEIIVARFRYKSTAGWGRTADISTSFPGVDFYHDFVIVGDKIDAGLAVSMKTTVVKDVDQWLSSAAIKDNIKKLTDGLQTGIRYNGKTVTFEAAQIHVYMPKDQMESLRSVWMNKLSNIPNLDKRISFDVKALEDFIQ